MRGYQYHYLTLSTYHYANMRECEHMFLCDKRGDREREGGGDFNTTHGKCETQCMKIITRPKMSILMRCMIGVLLKHIGLCREHSDTTPQ